MGLALTRELKRSLIALGLLGAALVGVIVVADMVHLRHGPALGWASLCHLCFLIAPAAASRAYPTLRDPRLYALTFLALPLGLVLFLEDSHLLVEWGWLRTTIPETAAVVQAELPALADFATLALPLTVILATLAPREPTRRALRRRTALLLGALALLAALWLWRGPAAGRGDLGWVLLVATPAVIAAPLALFGWRSRAGVGGAVAGLMLFALVMAQARLAEDLRPLWELVHGVDATGVTDTVEDYATFPPGTARLLTLAWPLLLAGIVAWEWIVMLGHRNTHDSLTDIYNKAYAETIVSQTGAHDLGARYAVAVIDIDHFKRVNDRHGHAAGDVVLKWTAAAIADQVRPQGVLCRTGGEELTVFFPGLEAEDAKARCEQVREAVAAMRVPVTNNDGQPKELRVTVSVGVSCNLSQDGQIARSQVQEVVDAADKALYKAKRRGRNKVVVE